MAPSNNLKGEIGGKMTFRIRTPRMCGGSWIIVEVPQSQVKIHFRASDIVQICRGIARLSIITCSCKAKTGIAHSKMAMDDSGWFYNSSCLQDARLSGWSRHSSVEVREDKNCTCDHHANEHHTTKDKESTR